MLTHLNSIFRTVLLTIFVSSLVACGGGDGGSTAPPPEGDTTPPRIIKTIPSSEGHDVVVGSYIIVTFDEEITTVTTNQVTIDLYVNGKYDVDNPISLNNADSFFFNTKLNELEVRLKPGDLKSNSKYRVTISKIKNLAGISIAGSCQWEFTTVDSTPITTGKTGVCGTDPAPPPGKPQNVTAAGNNGTVTVSWEVPKDGGEVLFYNVDKSIDNQQNFDVVKENIPASTLSVTDQSAQNGTSHIYRVVAVNAAGRKGTPEISNTVRPELLTGIPGSPQSVFALDVNLSLKVTWTAPTTGGAVTYYKVDKSVDGKKTFSPLNINIPATTLEILDPDVQVGEVYFYRVYAGNNDGLNLEPTYSYGSRVGVIIVTAALELAPQISTYQEGFSDIEFSSDSLTLVASAPRATVGGVSRAGYIQIFNNNGTSWTRGPTLNEATPITNNLFGLGFAFTGDSNSLFVLKQPSPDNTDDTLISFIKAGGSWSNAPTVTPLFNTGLFGNKVFAFSPDGTTFAVGEPYLATGNSGKVQLFTNTGGTWVSSQLLTSQAPAVLNQFGYKLAFSPDSNTLAVSELYGDPATVVDAGTVQLFTRNNTTWSFSQLLESFNPRADLFFGTVIAFSPVGSTLAVFDGEIVEIFTNTGGRWSSSAIVFGLRTAGNKMSFSSDGSKLAVGTYLLSKTGTKWTATHITGVVYPTFSKDGSILAGGGTSNGIIKIFNTAQFQ